METLDSVIKKLASGEIELHNADKLLSPKDAAAARRSAVEKLSNASLDAIGSQELDYDRIRNRNAENCIGSVVIPLGIAGPLKVSGDHADGNFYVPLATTEGALIASVNRGMKAITMSGGASSVVVDDGMARAPVFKFDSAKKARAFIRWLDDNYEKIKETAESFEAHAKLKSIKPFILGNNVWVRFTFGTGDAMGMNMVTISVEKCCEYIEGAYPEAECIAVSGNMCSDKKAAVINSMLGRGKTVVAEAIITKDILKKVFGTTAKKINDTNLRKNWLGSARAGSIQFNGHIANMIAALFIATGQDPAQVIDSSNGYTWTEDRDGDLYVSVTLPSLEIGTVGGGTALKTQTEALTILGVQGGAKNIGENSRKFAEIIAATVLAGELNLVAALSNKELGKAHAELGRGKKR